MSEQLQDVLDGISWSLEAPPQENLRFIQERDEEERTRNTSRIQVAIPELYRLVIYYPLMAYPGHGDEYYHRIEYATQTPITPLQVLESVSAFYHQPFLRENYDAIVQALSEEHEREYQEKYQPELEYEPGMRVVDTLGSAVFFEGLEPHEDGFTISLGS